MGQFKLFFFITFIVFVQNSECFPIGEDTVPLLEIEGEDLFQLEIPLVFDEEIPEDDSLAAGYFEESDPVLEQILIKDQEETLEHLMVDIREWARSTFIKQMSYEPNDEELEDYMFDMLNFLM